jgi:hypothetical protein
MYALSETNEIVSLSDDETSSNALTNVIPVSQKDSAVHIHNTCFDSEG